MHAVKQTNSSQDSAGAPSPTSRPAVNTQTRLAPQWAQLGTIQYSLKINTAGDQYEQEADRVAQQVIQLPQSPIVQRKTCACGKPLGPDGMCEACKRKQLNIQKKALSGGGEQTTAPPAVHQVLQQPGRPLDRPTRNFMESRFGQDFGEVRIHTDRFAAQSAEFVNAQAYTAGQNIVFGPAQYRPGTATGRQLLAHELTHVVQQRAASKPALQRKSAPTAGDAPKLDLSLKKGGQPCACLIVIHNDEQNARKTASLMHQHCAYNLLLLEPDDKQREIKLGGKIDPNELFPEAIAEKCLKDEAACRTFLDDKQSSTKPSDIEEFVKIQFFLAVKDCSNTFALPVIALHNNDMQDTREYLTKKKKGPIDVSDLKTDIDKTKDKEAGQEQVKELKERLRKKFGDDVKKKLTDTAGKTNIFRWCAANDLSKCHIGDPDHPDNVIWVTSEQDFETLSKINVNVALQSDLSQTAGSESEGDLSTLFLIIEKLIGQQLVVRIIELLGEVQVNVNDINTILAELAKLAQFDDLLLTDVVKSFFHILQELLDILLLMLAIIGETAAAAARAGQLRYLNIETPGKALSAQTDQERIEHYEFIVQTLKAVGLHCCGDQPTKAEDKVKEGLKLEGQK